MTSELESMIKHGHPTDDELLDLVGRLRRVIEPHRILLFGSLARNEFRDESDIDILVQVSDEHYKDLVRLNMKMYDQMAGFGRPVDIVVATDSQMATWGDTPGFVYREVARYGRPLYEAAA